MTKKYLKAMYRIKGIIEKSQDGIIENLKNQITTLEDTVTNYQSLYADISYNHDQLREKYQFLIDKYKKLKKTVIKVFKKNKQLSVRIDQLESINKAVGQDRFEIQKENDRLQYELDYH